MNGILLVEDRFQWRFLVNTTINIWVS